MDTLGSRLKMLRNNKNLTQEHLAKIFGVDRSTLGSWETNRREPDHATLQRIADFFGITVDFLLGRTPLTQLAEETIIPEYNLNAFKQQSDAADSAITFVSLPIYSEIRINDGVPVSQEVCGTLPYYGRKELLEGCFWLLVQGDSMYPRLFPGDYVLVHPQNDVDNGDTAVVARGREAAACIKRVQKMNQRIILHSFNSLYKPYEIPRKSRAHFHIIGKVIDMKAGSL